MKERRTLCINTITIIVCIVSLLTKGYSIYPLLIIILSLISSVLTIRINWEEVNLDTKKPLMWWYHKIAYEICYTLVLKRYIKHYNTMKAKYGFNPSGNHYK